MTELEYEKIARGPVYPVANEYAFGTIKTYATSITGNESLATGTINGNINYGSKIIRGSSHGPVRVGIFAASNSGGFRTETGNGYYGNMELAGNLWEITVSIGVATQLLYKGSHGDGFLTTESGYEGNATNIDWPGINSTNSRGVTSNAIGLRGGSFYGTDLDYFEISGRYYNFYNVSTSAGDLGGRGVRTADD